MPLFWEFYQQNLIHDATDTAYRAKGIAERGRIEIEDINNHYGRMVLLVTSLGELLIKKGILTEKELSDMILEIDTRDGKKDAKITHTPIICPKCGCGISRTFKKCLMCGYEDETINNLETI